jgi:hypothetical protein
VADSTVLRQSIGQSNPMVSATLCTRQGSS